MDDLRIIELYFNRDEQAIKETDTKYGKLCHSIAYNILNNHEDSEECVNDTYMSVWNTIPPTRPHNFMSFICKIARNLSLKRLEFMKRKKRSAEIILSLDELAAVLPDERYAPDVSDEDVGKLISKFLRSQEEYVRNVFIRSFTITSEALGVYKVALYVTEDGYLWTNAFDWQYLFNIGEDAASRIIHYAKENSTEVEYEPYRNSVAGTIIEITEEYIVVDDSILCKNPTDGITYKVLLNDLCISRYVDCGIVKVGDTVQISYEGEIDETSGNTIAGTISVFKATISDGDVLIPE